MNLEYFFPSPIPAGLMFSEEYLRQMIKVVVAKRMVAAVKTVFAKFECDAAGAIFASKNLETLAVTYRNMMNVDIGVMINDRSFAQAFHNYHKYNVINVMRYNPDIRGNIIFLYPNYGTKLQKLLYGYVNKFNVVILIVPQSERFTTKYYNCEILFSPSNHHMFIISRHIKFSGKMTVTKDTFGGL